MPSLITAYSFNELTKDTQDTIIDEELTKLFSEIYYKYGTNFSCSHIKEELEITFEEAGYDFHSFVRMAKANNVIYEYCKYVVIETIKDSFFVNRLKQTKISKTHQRIFLID